MSAPALHECLERLSRRRPVFHSERDFQHELAWQIRTQHPSAKVRLERPYRHEGEMMNIDLLVDFGGGWGGVELKYWRKSGPVVQHEGERFETRSDGAKDCARYDYWADVWRLERLVSAATLGWGAALVVTDDPTYRIPPRGPDTLDAAFRLHEGRVASGNLAWARPTGTSKGREAVISLRGRYETTWRSYSSTGRGFHSLTTWIDGSALSNASW